MKIYVASSWRNVTHYPRVVADLTNLGHQVYDFKKHAFAWAEMDANWIDWNPDQFIKALSLEKSLSNFARDMNALHECDACVMVLPCGKSAHLELGYARGACKKSYILQLEPTQPELMYLMADKIITKYEDLLNEFR